MQPLPDGRGSVSGRLELAAILTLAGVLCATLASLAWKTGITVDEPSHLLSSRFYWEGRDNLKPGDMPPLMKIVCGWVPVALHAPLPPIDHPSWKTKHEWNISQAMVETMSAEEKRRCFSLTRTAMIVFPLGTCLLLWWWGRQLFGPFAALTAAALFCLSPTVLGHGALVKNDMAATFGYLLFWYAAWVFWRKPSYRQTALLALALLAAMLAKYSMFILVFLAPAIVVLRFVTRGRFEARRMLGSLVLLTLATYAGVLAAWQFRMDPIRAEEVRLWRYDPSIPAWLLDIVGATHGLPLPGPVWRGGISLIANDGPGTPVYLNGAVRPGGSPLYFVEAMALKTPIATQLIVLTALALLLIDGWRRRLPAEAALWIVPGFLYLLLASLSSMQMGVRLVLPAMVFLFLVAGRCFVWALANIRTRAALLVAFVWLTGRTVSAYPSYIPFFNDLVGDSWTGLEYLSDSNVDWGQGIPRLAEWYREHPVGKLKVSFFSNDNVWAYFNDRQIELIYPPWSPEMVNLQKRYRPQPGYYAISASLLTGQYFAPEYRDYFRAFREMEPVGRAGQSIFIFHVCN